MDFAETNMLGRHLVATYWCPIEDPTPILDPSYANAWLNCVVNTTCSKTLFMMDAVYGTSTDPDCYHAIVYALYRTGGTFSGAKSFT